MADLLPRMRKHRLHQERNPQRASTLQVPRVPAPLHDHERDAVGVDQGENAPVYPAGTRVRHAVFGDGAIVSYDPDRKAYEIQFDILETTRIVSARVKMEAL